MRHHAKPRPGSLAVLPRELGLDRAAAARRARSRRCRSTAAPARLAVDGRRAAAGRRPGIAGRWPSAARCRACPRNRRAPRAAGAQIGGQLGAAGQRCEEFGGQHRVEQGRVARQMLGQARRPAHDLGDQRRAGRDWRRTARTAAPRPAGADRNGSNRAKAASGCGVSRQAPQQRRHRARSASRAPAWLRVARMRP